MPEGYVMNNNQLFVSLISPTLLFQGFGDLLKGRVAYFILSLVVSYVPIGIWILVILRTESDFFGSGLILILLTTWSMILIYIVVWIVNNFRYLREWNRDKHMGEGDLKFILWLLGIMSFVPPIALFCLFFGGMYLLEVSGILFAKMHA